MHIYLIRHPPPIDVDGLCYGRLDVAVDEKDIARTAESIVEQIPGQTLAAGAFIAARPRDAWDSPGTSRRRAGRHRQTT